MLKNKRKFVAIILALILLFSTTYVFAENEEVTEDYSLRTTEPIVTNDENEEGVELISNYDNNEDLDESSDDENIKRSDVYIFEDDVNIDYSIDGNLYVIGKNVTISSQINGDAFIMAKDITLTENAYIYSNLFSMSTSIDIQGVVYDAYILAENCSISGYIYRDAKIAGNTVNLNGVFGRNVYTTCSSLNFNTNESESATIYGNLEYSSSSEATIPEGVVTGDVKYTPEKIEAEPTSSIVKNYIMTIVSFIALTLIIWALCLWLIPNFLKDTNKYVGKQSLKLFGFGLLTVIVVPVICIILLLLQITANVSLLLFALYLVAMFIAKSLFTIVANNYLCSKLKLEKNLQIFGMLIVTSIIVYVLTKLPYLGFLLSLIATFLGLGILIKRGK